jgi:hypothetical protein
VVKFGRDLRGFEPKIVDLIADKNSCNAFGGGSCGKFVEAGLGKTG